MASRRQALADDIAQNHALSPSIRKKNVRNVPRIATVATDPTSDAAPETFVDTHAWRSCVSRSIAWPTSGGTLTSARRACSVVNDVVMASTAAAMYGMKAIAMITRV